MIAKTPVALSLTLVLAASAGCMSNEQAANLEFQQTLESLALKHQAYGKGDVLGIGGAVGDFALCKVLRNALSDNPQAQHLVLIKGTHTDATAWHLNAEVGTEVAFDLANYQSAVFRIYAGGPSSKMFTARRGSYDGAMWGYHTSVLDLAAWRGSVELTWNLPVLRLFGEVGLRAMQTAGDYPMSGGALTSKIGLAFGPSDLHPALHLLPSLHARGGYWMPVADDTVAAGIVGPRPSEIVERDRDLGAELNGNCPSAPFVQYHGAEADEDGYHSKRGKAMAEAILRSDWLYEGIASAAMARVALGLGIARDHGGFSAVCGGGAPQAGELDPSPIPQPRCPTVPGLNPNDVEVAGQTEVTEQTPPEGAEAEPPAATPAADDVLEPEAAFVAPEDGAQLVGPVKVEVQIANGSKFRAQSVSLKVDGVHVHEWIKPPFTVELPMAAGEHEIVALIKDPSGNIFDVAPVKVTVEQAASAAPAPAAPAVAPTTPTAPAPPAAAPTSPASPAVPSPGSHIQQGGGCSVTGAAAPRASWLLLSLLALARRRRRA